jgi:hypothetical protein
MVAAGFGYVKSKGEAFSKRDFATASLTGAAIGAFGAYFGVTYDNAETYLGSVGALTLLQQGVKAIVRRVVPWLQAKTTYVLPPEKTT